ncbi:Uncharacterised protein [Pantoea agglomerans]|uniref:Uncharacterized protein n=1 Tax=Enterobacter agglomerans TaxID=549 RepID=A0A379AJP5_ENTAG|nr:Uncharacterised protein [Pantoea agglomerans]
MFKLWPVAAFSLLLTGCGANNTPAQVKSPGAPTSSSLKVLETGASVMPVTSAHRRHQHLSRRIPFL